MTVRHRLGQIARLPRAMARRVRAALQPPVEVSFPDARLASLDAKSDQLIGRQTMFMHHGLDHLNRLLLLQGRVAANQLQSIGRLSSLAGAEFRVMSQWGEDGIIEWLCQKLPGIPTSFVEFGVENYAEANTRFLLENRGWRGLVMDGNDAAMRGLRDDALYWRQDLTAVGAFITRENILDLLAQHGFDHDLGILSIDIDGNDYWVMEVLLDIRAAIVICEINGVFGDLHEITIPYRADFQRLEAHFSGQYFGCSIRAVVSLAERRGYTFLGTNTNGVNAFFVRSDLAERVLDGLSEVRIWAPRHRDSRNVEGRLDFTRGLARSELIADLPVVDLRSNKVRTIRELGPLASDSFLETFR